MCFKHVKDIVNRAQSKHTHTHTHTHTHMYEKKYQLKLILFKILKHTYIENKYEYTKIEFHDEHVYNSYLSTLFMHMIKRFSIRLTRYGRPSIRPLVGVRVGKITIAKFF